MAMGETDGEVERGVRSEEPMDGTEIEIGMVGAKGMTGGTTGTGIDTMAETGIAGGAHTQGLGHLRGESDGETEMNPERTAGGESGPWKESMMRSGGGWTECTLNLLHRTVSIMTLTLDTCARQQDTIARQQMRATRHETYNQDRNTQTKAFAPTSCRH